jgi:DNA mismatch repair ATPase MutL
MNLKALEEAIQQLQSLALSSKNDAKKDSKKSKKDKKKKSRKSSKKKGKKRSKKSKRSRSSSSSSGSTSRSRSRSSSSSSSSSSNRPLRWKEDGKDKKVTFSDLSHIDQLKLKKKGDLIAFASKHPGALTAHFLASVYARLSKGTLARSAQLREVSVAAWANQFAGLAEIRDMKEVLTLAEILDNINRKEVARALDILVQRILAIQMAKSKGGSWEKSESIELLSSQKGLASSSMLALTNQ